MLSLKVSKDVSKSSEAENKEKKENKRLRAVSNGLCEHASSAFIFASKRSDQFCHASSKYFRNDRWRGASTSCNL